jgi:hypothetical protein
MDSYFFSFGNFSELPPCQNKNLVNSAHKHHPGNVPQANLAKLRYYHNLFMWLTWSELSNQQNNCDIHSYGVLKQFTLFRISFHCFK